MRKAGPLTRLVSEHVRQAESPANNNLHANAMPAPYNVQSPQPHAGFGHQFHSDETVIGLALGSPRQSPTLAVSSSDRDVDVSCLYSSPANPTSRSGNAFIVGGENKSIKRKGSKWKSLGSYFSRREVRSASPCYQLDHKEQPEPVKQLIIQDQLETNALRRKRADSDHGNKVHQIGIFRDTSREESSSLLRRASSRRRGPRRKKAKEPQPKMQQISAERTVHAIAENLNCHGDQQGSRMPGTSLLQVEIPSVAMERYSVMFGDVLKPLHSMRKPSLLACRQAHLEELHTVADPNSQPLDIASPKASMRANSISLKSSRSSPSPLLPSAHSNPAGSSANHLLQKPSPSSRSSTEPNHRLLSPKPMIKKSKSQNQDHVLVVHKSGKISGSPTSHGRQPSPFSFQRSANSAQATFSECAEYSGYSYSSIEADTATSTKGTPQDTLQSAFPARKSSMKKLVSPYGHQGEDTIDTAAQVSVARQISISRRQRQLLVPITPKTARQPIRPRINEQNDADESKKSPC